MAATPNKPPDTSDAEYLYFFPDHQVTRAELETLLRDGSESERAWAVSHLLRFAQWDDIWLFISRDQVREILPTIDLPETLSQAWARMLKTEEPVRT